MFNLSKYSELETAPNAVLDETIELSDGLQEEIDTFGQPKTQTDTDNNPLSEQLEPDEQRMSDMLASKNALQVINELIKKYPPETQGKLYSLPAYQQAQKDSANFDPGSFGFDSSPANKARFSQLEEISKSNPRFDQVVNQFTTELAAVDQNQRQFTNLKNSVPTPNSGNNFNLGFNLKRWKVAQNSSFPVSDAADLASKFMRRLVSTDPNEYVAAAQEILAAVRGEIQEEEINSMIESLHSLDPERDQDRAMSIFGEMYKILPERLKATQTPMPMPMESQVMSKSNPKGIIKFNLSDHILNNRQASDENVVGLVKTAADQFGQQYLLYGPTEKRICPKLRGKGGGQPGSGDVVSEYICRHHCLDGIVIDDNKTICGEALWRANVMDKQSREYVDADGNITGGYIEKRFQVDHNVPEENKMRLKPGETRKPRPAAWGNLESRLQDMRKKEADKRGYRPDSNTGDPFEWCHDVDQNNVEQSQAERDRREEAMGHKTVQYTNKANQENNPKTASKKSFNLKSFKTAQMTGPRGPVGPDNPRSDDLGLSPDYDSHDDYDPMGETPQSPLVDEMVSSIQQMKTTEEVINFLTAQILNRHQVQMNSHDWDDVLTEAMHHLSQLGQSDDEVDSLTNNLPDYMDTHPSRAPRHASIKMSQKCNCGKDKCDCKKAFNLKNYKVAQTEEEKARQRFERSSPGPYPQPWRYDKQTGQMVERSQKGLNRALRQWEHRDEKSKNELRPHLSPPLEELTQTPEEVLNAKPGEILNIYGVDRICVNPEGPYPDQPFFFSGKGSGTTVGQYGRIMGKVYPDELYKNPQAYFLNRRTPNLDKLYNDLNNRGKKSFNLKNYKTAQGSGIPTPMDGANPDRFLETPKRRKPMLTPDSDIPGDETPGSRLSKDNWEPNVVRPDGQVIVPGGDVVDRDEANRRELKELATRLMEWNTGTGTGIADVANAWSIGEKAEGPSVQAAIKEMQAAIHGGVDESKVSEAQNLIDHLNEHLSGQTEQDDSQITEHDIDSERFNDEKRDWKLSSGNAWWMKESKKKYNPWAVCNKSTGGKSEGEEKFERCVHHVKDQNEDKDMKSCCAASDTKKKKLAQYQEHIRQHYESRPQENRTLYDSFQRGRQLVDKEKGPKEIADTLRGVALKGTNRIRQMIVGKPQTNLHQTQTQTPLRKKEVGVGEPKPMEINPLNRDQSILRELLKSPILSGHFQDTDEVEDFLESLDEQEMRIIIDSNDPKIVLELKGRVQNDLDDTAKQLAMED